MFAHGSGSSRRIPRNRRVAADHRAVGLATLLFAQHLGPAGKEQKN